MILQMLFLFLHVMGILNIFVIFTEFFEELLELFALFGCDFLVVCQVLSDSADTISMPLSSKNYEGVGKLVERRISAILHLPLQAQPRNP